MHDHPSTPSTGSFTIRRLGAADSAAVRRLADLDGSAVPGGPLLGADVEGRLLAVISLSSGLVVANPFSPTAELTDLLELRRHQLTARQSLDGRARFRRRATDAPHARTRELYRMHAA